MKTVPSLEDTDCLPKDYLTAPNLTDPHAPGNIVCAYKGPRDMPENVWQLAVQEFFRNGRKMLTPGKLRWLRRQAQKRAA